MLYYFDYVNVCLVPKLTEYFICLAVVHLDMLDLRKQVQCLSERAPRYFTEVVEICLFSSNLILKKLVFNLVFKTPVFLHLENYRNSLSFFGFLQPDLSP